MNKATRATPIATGVATTEETDGRRRRSEDSRARIVAAMLELVHDGDISPGAEQVAARAQVGLRTVFRHFKDMESLYREGSQKIEAELRAVIATPLTGADWRERINQLIQRRSVAFERIAPYKRAADVHRSESIVLQGENVRLIGFLRAVVRNEVPDEVAADPVTFEALDLLLSYEVWSRLRQDQGLSPKKAATVVEEAVRRLLG